MSDLSAKKVRDVKIYITNLGKYVEGYLIGKWVQLPIDEDDLEKVLEEPGVQIRIFGKPEIAGHRRVGVILATDESVAAALAKAERAYSKLEVKVY